MASESNQSGKTTVLPSSFGQTLLFTLVRKAPWDDELCDDLECKNPATVMCVECSGAFCPTHQPGAFTEDELDKEVLINAKELKSARYYEMRICHQCARGFKPGHHLVATHPRTGELLPFIKQLLPRMTGGGYPVLQQNITLEEAEKLGILPPPKSSPPLSH